MKKNSTVISSVIFFTFILSMPVVAHAALAEPGRAMVWEQKGFLVEGSARLFSYWLNHKKPDAPILKIKTVKPLSNWARQLNASRLVATSA